MALRFKNFHEKFVALHQSVVLLIGLAVITISPEGSFAFFLPFGIALAPILFYVFTKPHTSAAPEGHTPRLRTYRLSSFIGVLCALVLMGMWFVWLMIEIFREIGYAG